jgi:hypothetical protein
LENLVYQPINSVNHTRAGALTPIQESAKPDVAVHGREKDAIFRSSLFFFFFFLGKARLSPSAERFLSVD